MKFHIFYLWIILLFTFVSSTLSYSESQDFEYTDDGFMELNPDESVFDMEPEAVPTCEKDEFQCSKSLECIEKYKFCDHVIDCKDSSDEITCGVLDFDSPALTPNSFGGWTNVDNAWTRKPNYITTGVNKDKMKEYTLSYNLRGIAISCQLMVRTNIFTDKDDRIKVKTELHSSYNDGQFDYGGRYTFLWLEKGATKNTANITDFRFEIKGSEEQSAEHDRKPYVFKIIAKVDTGDELAIYGIDLENCNRRRTIGDCDFESGTTCRWNMDPGSTLKWTVEQGNASDNSPIIDHTKATQKGHYLYAAIRKEDEANHTTSGKAILTSHLLNWPSCLSFWYYPSNSEFLTLSVHASSRSNDENWRHVASFSDGRLDEWNYAELDSSSIFMFEYNLHIQAEIGDVYGSLSVDDIQVKGGKCEKQNRVCTFEKDNCGYIINNPTDMTNSTWQRLSGEEVNRLIGISITDHTRGDYKGHMMVFSPNGTNDMSFLSGPYWADAGYRCLQFYYYLSDDELAQLEVVHHHNEDFSLNSWSKKYGYLKRRLRTTLLGGWRKTKVTLSPLDDARFEFVATALVGDPGDGFLAIDDITITSGQCQPPLTCDFELNDCGWTNNKDVSSGYFERISAKRKIKKSKPPPRDHTLGNDRGHYLFFGFPRDDNGVTTILSDDFAIDKTRCFSFWTYFSTVSNIRVDVYLITQDGSQQLSSTKGQNSTEWKYHEMNVDPAKDNEVYQLMVTATPFDFIEGQSVAIDDIELSPFKCGYRPKNRDDDIEPKKRPKEVDVPDFRCDFEGNLCKFENLQKDGYTWTVVEAKKESKSRGGPLVDHTLHSFYGKYLSLQPDQDTKKKLDLSVTATLASKMVISPYMDFLNDTINDVCLDFWYVMDGESISTLSVSVANEVNDNKTELFRKTQTFGPTWRHEQVGIRFYEDFHIFFVGTTSNPDSGILGLDDVKVKVGQCPPLDNDVCDFATDFCGWDNNASLPMQFKIVSPNLANYYAIENGKNFSTILPEDRYNSPYGNYLFLNVSYSDTETKKGQFISPILTPEKRCLQLYYYHNDPYQATMRVYALYNKLDNLKYLIETVPPRDLHFWMFRQFQVEKHFLDMDFQFVIELERSNNTSFMYRFGLDSLEILDSCPPLIGCDFEDGMCQYKCGAQFAANQGIWVRGHGASDWHKGPSPLAPPGDHTVGHGGVFLYVDQPPGALLETPIIEVAKTSCLSFWYYMASVDGSNDELSLIVQLVGFDLPIPNQLAVLFYKDYKSDLALQGAGVWARRRVTVNTTSQNSILEFIGAIKDKKKHFLALDDINWTEGDCDKKKYTKFACTDNPKKEDLKPLSAVCNFEKDCPNNHDEENCGYYCDFRKDLCGWTIKNVTSTFVKDSKNNDWIQDEAFQETMVILQDQPGVFNNRPEAMLESPWLQNSGPLCAFDFSYILHDPKDKAGEVIVKIIEENNPVGIEIYKKVGNDGASWTGTMARIGRIKRRFKIQVTGKLRVREGRGHIAFTKFAIDPRNCRAPSKIHDEEFVCGSKLTPYKCDQNDTKTACYGEEQLCDFVDDCPGGTDETAKQCSDPARTALACDFEEGICDWSLPSPHKNGWKWTKVEEIDDYTYGVKRDHTINNQFGHLLYIWNKQKQNGTLVSPMIWGKKNCAMRFYYMFSTKTETRRAKIGLMRISVKYSSTGKLYKLREIDFFSYRYFQRFDYKFDRYEGAPFYVVIEVFPGQDHNGMWALDDISFTSDCLPEAQDPSFTTDASFTPIKTYTKGPNFCSDGFVCDGGVRCIEKAQVCDFEYNCNDGSDESKCGVDGFDNGWKDESQGRVYWHPENKELKTEIKEGTGDTAQMASVIFGQSYSKCSMSFDYYVDTVDDTIELNLFREQKKVVDVARLFDSSQAEAVAYGKWTTAKIYIGAQPAGWYLLLRGTKAVANDKVETMRIRNFHIRNCDIQTSSSWKSCQEEGLFTCASHGCVSQDQVCDFSVDCPTGSDEQNCRKLSSFMCSFEVVKLRKNGSDSEPVSSVKGPTCELKMNDMKRFSAKDLTGFFGPGLDHTTNTDNGHFLMTDDYGKGRLELPVFEPTRGGDCYFRFWYMMDGDAAITVQNNLFGVKDQIRNLDFLESKDINDSFVWKRYSTTIVSKYEFQPMLLTAHEKSETRSFVAIDDISFSAGCQVHKGKPVYNVTTPKYVENCLNDQQFACHDGTCYPLEFQCDFYKNCKDGEDEELCPDACDFDHTPSSGDPTCGWGESDSEQNPVMIRASVENANSAPALTKYYPPRDATLGTQAGYFMLVYPVNFTNTVDTAHPLSIFSAEFSSATPGCTFEMDYYITVLDEDKVKPKSSYSIALIYDAAGGVYSEVPWFVDASDSSKWNKWIHVLIGIGRRENTWQLNIGRTPFADMYESFAFDNAVFKGCSYTPPHYVEPGKPIPECPNAYTCYQYYNCIPYDQMCDMKKDCPLGDDEANCKERASTFEGTTSGDFKVKSKQGVEGIGWELIAGTAPEKETTNSGPPFDHTFFNRTGHYLFGRFFDPAEDSSIVSSTALNKIGQGCELRFYYFMNFYLNDSIRVYKNVKGQRTLLHDVQSTMVDNWMEAKFNLDKIAGEVPLKIEIQGVGLKKSSIGIDDISFSEICTNGLPYTGLPTPTTKQATTTTTTPTTTTTTDKGPNNPDNPNNPVTDPTKPVTDDPNAPSGPCDNGDFYCAADKTCLPSIVQCNFVADCSNGADELAPLCTQPKCVFNTDRVQQQCGMTIFATNPGYNWSTITWDEFIGKAPKVKINTLPPVAFAFVNQTTQASFAPTSIMSHVILETGHQCSLRFYYICNTANCPIQVSQANYGPSNTGSEKVIWLPVDDHITGDSDTGYTIQEARIFIGRQSNFIISITSIHHYGSTGYVMLESIAFKDCENAKYDTAPFTHECADNEFQCLKSYGNCVKKDALCDYEQDCRLSEDEANCDKYVGRCDFENPVLCEFWGYDNLDARWSWIVETGLMGLPYLPRMDHTGPKEEQYFLSFHSSVMKNYVRDGEQFFFSRFKSDIIAKRVTSACRFRVWHNILGKNCSLTIYKRYSPTKMTQLKKITSGPHDYWVKEDLSLSESDQTTPQDFDIVLEAQVGVKNKCSVNIDDISMTPSCYPTGGSNQPEESSEDDMKNTCKPNLMCRNKQCYTKNEQCNFIDDCNDGTDEEKCQSTCSFDDRIDHVPELCGWYVPKTFQGSFERIRASDTGNIAAYHGPKIDHTKGSASGYFIQTTKFSQENQKLELHSPFFRRSAKNCRFSFAAFFEDFEQTMLKVYLKNAEKLVQVWPNKTAKEDKRTFHQNWGIGNIFIGKQENFSLLFEMKHSASYLDNNIFFDDLNFRDCARDFHNEELVCGIDEYKCDDQSACVPYFKICDGSDDCKDASDEKHCIQTNGTCWFESENWRTVCNWGDLEKDFKWKWMSKPMSNSDDKETNTGPQELLENKYNYLLLDSRRHNFSQRAAVQTQQFPASSGVCSFNFHYYMYGSPDMGELFVYSLGATTGRKTELFRHNHQQGPQWNYVENLMVSSEKENFTVVFEGAVGANIYTDIALGYVSFSRDCAAGKWTHGVRNGNLTDLENCAGFYCHKSHECIPRDWVCDGEVDCRDGSDEVNCSNVIHHSGKHSGRVAAISLSIFAGICVVSIISVVMYRRIINASGGVTGTGTTDSSAPNSFLYRRLDRSRQIRSPISIEMTSRKS